MAIHALTAAVALVLGGQTQTQATLVVVHDGAEGALDVAMAATSALQSHGSVIAIVREAPLPATCARDPACAERPAGALLIVETTPAEIALDLVDSRGTSLRREVLTLSGDSLEAALAPALQRLASALTTPAAPSPVAAAPVVESSAPAASATVPSEDSAKPEKPEEPFPWVQVVAGGAGVVVIGAIGTALILEQSPGGRAVLGNVADAACSPFQPLAQGCANAACQLTCALSLAVCQACLSGASATSTAAAPSAPAAPLPRGPMRY